jgi:UDP-N-acetylmuramyl pentapeptide phosphotransferase/UDP-N-acetylglucosamine-1-phosphate transferase
MVGDMNFFLGFGITAIAFTASYLLVSRIQHWAEQRQIFDIPNSRSLHTRPVPRGGGLAIVIVTFLGIGVLWYVRPLWDLFNVIILAIGGVLIAGISYWDDLHSLPYWIRFAVHLAVAGIVVIGIGYWRILPIPFFKGLDLGWIGLPVTFLWIVGMINAYNFMDGIDGIAGGQGVVAGLGWAVLGWLSGQFLVAGIGVVIAASCLGFLGHNWSPARIFMGDVGSAFLGYTFAVLPVVAGQHDSRLAFAGVLLVWPFVFDTGVTFLRRLLHRENVFTAHCSHLYQRWVATGYSHKKTASLYIGISSICLVCSAALVLERRWADYLTVIIIVITSLILWLGTNWRERSVSKATTPQ